MGTAGRDRRAAPLAALALALGPWLPWAQNRVVAEIPIELERNKTVVPVTVGSSPPLRLVLDSGMPYDGLLLYDIERVDRRHFSHLEEALIGGAGAGSASRALTDGAATFSVGPLKVEDQRVTLLTGGTFKGAPTDGVIGYTLLGHYAVEVDFDRRRMVLYEPSTFTPEAGWASVDITFRENRIPWLDVCVATRKEEPVRLAAYLDCASGENLELLRRRRNAFKVPARGKERYAGRGLSGDIVGRDGRVGRLLLGPFALEDVAVLVVPAQVRSKQKGADAVLANGVLRRFNVVFDYAHAKIHLRPNRSFKEPFP